jgi:hypothetical protein
VACGIAEGGGRRAVYDYKALIQEVTELNASDPVFPFVFGDLCEIDIVDVTFFKEHILHKFLAQCAIFIFQRQPC